MKSQEWSLNVFWLHWRIYWARPWGATGWTPTLRNWQVGPFRLTRFYQPERLQASEETP